MIEINNEKVKKLGKCYNIIDSPQVIFQICDKAYKRSRQKPIQSQHFKNGKPQFTKRVLQQKKKQLKRKVIQSQHKEKQQFQKEQINHTFQVQMDLNQSDRINKKLTQQRKFYSLIKQRLKQILKKIQQPKESMLSEVMLLKQDILSSFFAQIIQKTKTQCRQKGMLLHYIWNSTFSILEVAMKQLVSEKYHNQKQYLAENISNHETYQNMLQYDKQTIKYLRDQLHRAEVLNNTVIFNSRCKRRQLRKAYIKLKLTVNKLNEYKENYLQLQKDYIDLMMQIKDISRETAEFLFKRRQEIVNDKRKTIKLKFSKKSNFKDVKKQLQSQNPSQAKRIKEQLKTAFDKQYNKQVAQKQGNLKKIKKLQNFLFQDAMDEFAYYQNNDLIDDDLFSSKNRLLFVDAETDMLGFQLNVQQKDCQVEYIDRIFHNMLKNTGSQTQFCDEKIKKIYVEELIQVDIAGINQQKLRQFNKVVDMSFLFEKKVTPMIVKEYTPNNTGSNFFTPTKKGKQQRLSIRILDVNSGLKSKKRSSRKSRKSSVSVCENEFEQHQNVLRISKNSDDLSRSITKIEDQENNAQNLDTNDINDEDLIDFSSKFALKRGIKKNNHSIRFNRMKYSNNQFSDSEIQSELYQNSLQSKHMNSQENFTKRRIRAHRKSNLSESKHNINIVQGDQTERKHLKRQFIRKNQNQKPHENNLSRFKQFKNSEIQQKQNIINMISKSSKKIDSVQPQSSWFQSKKQNPLMGIQNNGKQAHEIIKFHQQKQKQEFFKKFIYSLEPLINDLFKHIEVTKKYNKSLIPSREKTLLKTISNVYLQSYKMFQKDDQIFSLINPLLKYFQFEFGTLKKSQLYTKIISFLSHIYLFKESSHIFNSFIFFTGVDKNNPLSIKITNQDFLLYLKLLKTLSFNFDFLLKAKNFSIDNLFTSNNMLEKYTRSVLKGENINQAIIDKIIAKVYEKLEIATGSNLCSKSLQKEEKKKITSNSNSSQSQQKQNMSLQKMSKIISTKSKIDQEEEIKLDVFFCTKLIMQEYLSIKVSLQESYMPLISAVYESQEEVEQYRVDETLIRFIIRCQFLPKESERKCQQMLKSIFKISTLYHEYKIKKEPSSKLIKTQRTLKTIKLIENQNQPQNQNLPEKQTISVGQMCSLFLKTNISDLNKTYYNALSLFKIKQQAAYTNCLRRMKEMKSYFQKNKFEIESILVNQIMKEHQMDIFSSAFKLNPFANHSSKSKVSNSPVKTQQASQPLRKQSLNGKSLKHVQNKKLLILCQFRFLDLQANKTLQNMIGDNFTFLYDRIQKKLSK